MIGEKIKKLRLENKMTQKALADKLFVTAQAVSRWENGEVEPSVTTIIMLAKIFGISTDDLLGLEGEQIDADDSKFQDSDNEHEFAYEKREKERIPRATCSACYDPIYEKENAIRYYRDYAEGERTICKKCADSITLERRAKIEDMVAYKRVKVAKRRRLAAFIVMLSFLAIGVIGMPTVIDEVPNILIKYTVTAYVMTALIFTFLLRNTFIGRLLFPIANVWKYMFEDKYEEGSAKYFFAITLPSYTLGIFTHLIAVVVYVVSCVFIFPYSVYRSIKYPGEIYLREEFWRKDRIFMHKDRTSIINNPYTILNNNIYSLMCENISETEFSHF